MIHGAESYLLKTLKIPERLFYAAVADIVVYLAPYLLQKPAYDPVRQFTYIGQISQGAYIVTTRGHVHALMPKEVRRS